MLNSDLPIKIIEEDALNRSSFSESLAKVMLDYTVPEGFAIGLYGRWGSGKTSVINMVLESVDKLTKDTEERPIILRFNPWLCSDPKQLISQFFKQLSSAVKIKSPKLEHICSFMEDYADAFELAGVIPIAGNILTTIGKVLGKKAKAYNESKNNDLQRIKDGIIKDLLHEKLKIIVTIDDVDRLSNNEIISVFQLVKSLADFPYTIYLLAFDRDVVIRALREVQKGDGAEYLEKVIQVPFELPTPNAEDIYQVFFKKFDSIISNIPEEQWDKEYWGELFHYGIKPYLQSIRDVVRFANVFALKYALLRNETNVIDLIGLTCIQVFEPEVYSRLPSHKEQLCGGANGYYDQYQREKEKVQNSYNIIVAGIEEKRAGNIKNILVKLFPKLYVITNNSFGFRRQYNQFEALKSGSIANSDCFNRYFVLMLEPNAIPRQEIDYLLFQASVDELREGIIKINSLKKATKLLDHIRAAFEGKEKSQEYGDRARQIFKCLLWCWHTLDNNEDSEFLSLPFDWRLLFTAETLLKVIDESERYVLLYTMFSDENVDISTANTLLRNFERQNNRFTDKAPPEQDKLISLDKVKELEKIFVERTVSEFESGNILNNSSALNVIWLFEQLDEIKAKEYTDKMINSDMTLAKFISASVGHGKGAGRTVYKFWDIRKDDIKKYTDIDSAYERMTTFVHTCEFKNLPNDKRENIAAFLVYMERTDVESGFRDSIMFSDIEEMLKRIEV